MENPVKIGIIGGSGLYQMPGLQNPTEVSIETPFGDPSDPILIGELEEVRVAFLSRHGRGHRYMPSEVPYRANIFALKMLGIERIVSISACGSLHEDFAPGHIAVPDQLVDHTRGLRTASFFGQGLVAHVGVADPFCTTVRSSVAKAVESAGGTVHREGTLITIEGPRFSTKAESKVYRQWGMSLIGMTACPEAFLAREAGICYATMAHITDYDVWHENEGAVTVERVLSVLRGNLELAQSAIRHTVKYLSDLPRACPCETALHDAIITDPQAVPKTTRRQLEKLTSQFL